MNTFKNIAMLLALSLVSVFSTGCDQVSSATSTVGGWVGLTDDTDPELAKKVDAYNDAAKTMVDSLEEANDKLAEIQQMAAEAEALEKQYTELWNKLSASVSEVNLAMIGLEEHAPTMTKKMEEVKDRIKTALDSVNAYSANVSEKISVLVERTQQTVDTVETVQVKAAEGTTAAN